MSRMLREKGPRFLDHIDTFKTYICVIIGVWISFESLGVGQAIGQYNAFQQFHYDWYPTVTVYVQVYITG